MPQEIAELIRDTVDRLYGRYLARQGKPRWCDKSLDSVLAAELLAEVYPEALFVCLYRHCMDVVASGIEACPWGVSRFGFDPFVAQNPGNNVAAIASYWVEWATMMLAFEEAHPERCHRVRYEDLAAAPEEVSDALLRFLGATPMPGITTACFSAPHEGDGPGDEKIWFTTNVSTETIGRGIKVPADAMPDPLLERVNSALSKLGYRPVGSDWSNSVGPADPRLPGTGPQAELMQHTARPEAASARRAWPGDEVLTALRARLREQTAAAPKLATELWPVVADQTVSLVVASGGRQGEVSWTFPAADGDDSATSSGAAGSTDGDSQPVATFIAPPEVWRDLLDGHANVITEIRHGRLRCINRRDTFRVRSDEVHAVAWLLGLSQVPLVHRATSESPEGSEDSALSSDTALKDAMAGRR